MPAQPKRVLAVVEDLFFVVKITEAAKRAGFSCDVVRTAAAAIEKAAAAPPLLIVIDLNARALEPVELIATLKATPALQGVSIVGFVSHVEVELKLRAQAAGADMVLARSAFSLNLPQLLARHSARR
jgi:CheY-like chemotaxis protein